MDEPKDPKDTDSWMLRRPLQLEHLRQELSATSGDLELELRRLQHCRENVDAVVYALSNPDLAADRREHLLKILAQHREALDGCLGKLGLPPRVKDQPALWHFNQLEPIARTHLASILGVPEEPPYFDVLEIKAEEYLAQHDAFGFLANRLHFNDATGLRRMGPRAALVLTLSGSLIQLSEPLSRNGTRRYLYQNIYGNTHPPEGLLVLDRDIRPGHRLRSVELTTSPVRLLQVLDRKVPWSTQTQGFETVANTLSSLVSRSNSQIVESGWIKSQTGVQRQVNPEAAQRVFFEDNAEALRRYQELRERFMDRGADEEEARGVEAELLTVCHYLQTATRELGFEAKSLEKVRQFTTEGGRTYATNEGRPGTITITSSSGGPDVVLSNVSLGRQVVARGAPLAFVGGDGGLVEVTLPVVEFKL